MILEKLKINLLEYLFPGIWEIKATVLERSLVQLHLYGSDFTDDLHQSDLFGNKCVFFRMRLCLSFFQS